MTEHMQTGGLHEVAHRPAAARSAPGRERLCLVVFQEEPGLWMIRGLEHDLVAQGPSIGEAVRAVVKLVQAHTAFDARHNLNPLAAFRPSPQQYWNAFHVGTPLSLAQLGVAPPADWQLVVAVTHHVRRVN